jgi:hypothetical protein
MVTFLITSALILGLFAIAVYFWQKPADSPEPLELPPGNPPRALFADSQPIAEMSDSELTAAETNGHAALFERAQTGDLSVLLDARRLDVYSEVLNACLSEAASEAKLLSLASHVVQNNLPVNDALAEAMMQFWQASPNRQTTTKLLHIAALSDDAEIYRKAVEATLGFWREGKLPDLSAPELQALFNSEFWLLSSEVRSSGTGFILKRTLSSARRELEGTTTN